MAYFSENNIALPWRPYFLERFAQDDLARAIRVDIRGAAFSWSPSEESQADD